MNLLIKNKIYISEAPARLIKILKRSLTIPNPIHTQMLRRVKWNPKMRRALYGLKKEFKYYEEKDGVFICGRGCEKNILKYCEKNCIEVNIKRDTVDKNLKKPLKFKGELRDYQEGITDMILNNGNVGTIKLGTGFGKTIMAFELIRKLNKTALIIVPRTSILNQFKKDLKDLYDYDIGVIDGYNLNKDLYEYEEDYNEPCEAGIIQGKTWDIKDITIASSATLKKRECKDISRRFSIVIADEAHTFISDLGINCVQEFSPAHLYGLTATPDRSDGQGNAVFFTFGPILIDKELPQEKPEVEIVKSNIEIPVKVEYADMINGMVGSDERNMLISGLALQEVNNGRKVLILTKRVEHSNSLTFYLKDKETFQISSDMNEKEKDILLTKLRKNEIDFDIIIGTFSLLSTGVDIPVLDTLIIAGDLRSSVLTQQSAGRVLRLFSGKQTPKIIDIDDNKNKMLHSQALERRRFYKKKGWLN